MEFEPRDISVSNLEKLLVNFALPSDLVYHTFKSMITRDKYSGQTFVERAKHIWKGKIDKYYKILYIKDRNNGQIHDRVKKICKTTPCGYVRLMLAYLH